MTRYFFDSSALVKFYVNETGSAWIRNLIDNQMVIISRLTTVELVSALARYQREKRISNADFTLLKGAFLRDVEQRYAVISLLKPVFADAQILLVKHALRTLDSIQLASSIKAHSVNTVTFLSSDTRLLSAAAAEGLPTDDPNLHP